MFNDTDRGQVGIGTLIVFIAMVLVAAIAAGVLINTAGMLQTQAEATGEESTQQVADRLQIQSATGTIRETDPATINQTNLTVTKSPGAGDIQLDNVSFEIVTDDEVITGVLTDTGVTVGSIAAQTPENNVITDRADRYEVQFNLNEDTADNIVDGGLSVEAGDSVTITLTTAPGASVVEELRVPDSLIDRDAVKL